MKLILKTSILALAGVALLAPSAKAITYSDGDLLLSFRATGGTGATTDYVVDIGSASSFATGGANATGSLMTLGIGNISTDLASIYGAGWATRSDLLWSVSGVQIDSTSTPFTDNTSFASRQEATPGTASSPWTRQSISAGNITGGYIQSFGQQYGQGTTSDGNGTLAGGDQIASSNNTKALLQPTGKTNSYAYFEPGGAGTTATQSYSAFTGSTTAGGIEGNFANGAPSSILDLYQVSPQSSSPKGPSSLLGGFEVTNSGALKFDSSVAAFAAVPEPATFCFGFAMIGACAFGRFRNRRQAAGVIA